jgi:protoporphyrinogen oxidase
MKNFSPYMSPKDKTSLFIEFFCFEGDKIWNMQPKDLLELALPYCEKAGFFTRAEIKNYYHIKKKNVYPIYDLVYKDYLKEVKAYLDKIPNLYFIGRPGRFRYNNQDHSLEMGMMAAKSIIDGVHYDIESVGEEKEYFESGKVYQKPNID